MAERSTRLSEPGTIEARALTRAANYFRGMSQETLTRRRVIEILDYLASEAEPSPSDRCDDCGLMRRTHLFGAGCSRLQSGGG